MLIGDIAANNARRYPDKNALLDAGRVHTWSQVDVGWPIILSPKDLPPVTG